MASTTDWLDASGASLPAGLAYFTLTGQVAIPVADSADEGLNPDLVEPAGQIILSPTIRETRYLGDENNRPLTIALVDIAIPMNRAGQLYVVEGEAGARILNSSDPHLNPTSWSYTVKFQFEDIDDVIKPKIEPFEITPPPPREDGEPWVLDITELARVAGTGQPLTKEMTTALAAAAWEAARRIKHDADEISANVGTYQEVARTATAAAASSARDVETVRQIDQDIKVQADKITAQADVLAGHADTITTQATTVTANAAAAEQSAERAATEAATVRQLDEQITAQADRITAQADTLAGHADTVTTQAATVTANAAAAEQSAERAATEAATVRQLDEQIKAQADKITAQADVLAGHADTITTQATQVTTAATNAQAAATGAQEAADRSADSAAAAADYLAQTPVEFEFTTVPDSNPPQVSIRWRRTGADATEWSAPVVLNSGIDGISVVGADLTEAGDLTLQMSRGEDIAVGNVRGPRGFGFSNAVIDENYHLILTLENGTTFDAGESRGKDGAHLVRGTFEAGTLTLIDDVGREFVVEGNLTGPVGPPPTIINGSTRIGGETLVTFTPTENPGEYRADTTIVQANDITEAAIEDYLERSPLIKRLTIFSLAGI